MDNPKPMEGERPGFCRAHSSQTGQPCRRRVKPGAKVCAMHGAKGGRPVEHGRFSKHLGRLQVGYDESRLDRSLLDLREPIAAMDAIVRRLAERVEEHDTPAFRGRLLELLEESRGGDDKAAAARMALYDLIERGATEDEALVALRDTLSELSKRIEGWWKVKLDKKQAIGAAEQRVLMARFLDIVATVASVEVAQECGRRLHGELGASRN